MMNGILLKKPVAILVALIMMASMLMPFALADVENGSTDEAVVFADTDEETSTPSEDPVLVSGDDWAYDNTKSLSEQLTAGWNIPVARGPDAAARDALGGNPLGVPAWDSGQVGTLSITPKELIMIDGMDVSDIGQLTPNRANSYLSFYDITGLGGASATIVDKTPRGTYPGYDTYSNPFPTGGGSPTQPTAGNIRTAIAADLNGDGNEEIVYVYLDKGNRTLKEAQTATSGISFKTQIGFLSNSIHLEGPRDGLGRIDVRPENTETIRDYPLPTVSARTGNSAYDAELAKRYVPENTYDWSSFLQVVKGDFTGDGKEQVIAALGPAGVYSISIDKYGDTFPQPIMSGSYMSMVEHSTFSLAVGDVDGDGIDELIVLYSRKNYEYNAKDFPNNASPATARGTDYLAPTRINIFKHNGSYFRSVFDENIYLYDSGYYQMANAGVAIADIDYDGRNEIVIGGFKMTDYSRNMYLAYMNYEDLLAEPLYKGAFRKGVSLLTSSNGKSAMLIAKDVFFHAAQSSREHKIPALKNERFPMQRVCLTGQVGGNNFDQIFFGNALYYLNQTTGVFDVFHRTGNASTSTTAPDYKNGPNAAVLAVIPDTFLVPSSGNIPADREQLMVITMAENNIGTSPKPYYIRFYAEFLHMPVGAPDMDVRVSKIFLGEIRHPWTTSDPYVLPYAGYFPLVTAPNIDDDTYFLQYVGKMSTVTNPVITAVLQAPPYFGDVPAFLDKTWYPGGTSYGKSESAGSGVAENYEMSKSYSGGKGFGFDVFGMDIFGYDLRATFDKKVLQEYEELFTITQSFEYSNQTSSDLVVMQSQPLDIYFYFMYIPEADRAGMETPPKLEGYPEWWVPVTMAMPDLVATRTYSIPQYNENVRQHNIMAQIYNAENPTLDPKVPLLTPITYGAGTGDLFRHTIGDPFSYPGDIPITPQNISSVFGLAAGGHIAAANTMTAGFVDAPGPGFSHVASSIALDQTIQEKDMESGWEYSGTNFDLTIGGYRFGRDVEKATVAGTMTEHTKGIEFGSKMNAYRVPGYEVTARLHAYNAKMDGAAVGGALVLAYTRVNANGLPKLPDNIRILGTTKDTITVGYDIPVSGSGSALVPDRYELQILDKYSGKWNTVAYNDGRTTGSTLPVERGQTNSYIIEYVDTVNQVKLQPSTNYKIKMVVQKGGSPDRPQAQNEFELSADTKADGPPPIIDKQPRDVYITAGEDAAFSISARPPDTDKNRELRYRWSYAVDNGESDPPLTWVQISDGTQSQGALAGAVVSGAFRDSLNLANVPLSADNTRFMCEVGYLLDDTPVNRNSDSAGLYVRDPNMREVTYSAEGSGTISAAYADGTDIPSGTYVPNGTAVTFTAVPQSGFEVQKWIVTRDNSPSTNVTSDTSITETVSEYNIDVIVYFGEVGISINYGARGNGTVSAKYGGSAIASGATVTPGRAAVFTAAPGDGHAIDRWEIKNQQTGEYETVLNTDGTVKTDAVHTIEKASENIDIMAVFVSSAPSGFVVTYSAAGHGSVSAKTEGGVDVPSGGRVPAETRVVFTAVPDSGATVQKWDIKTGDSPGTKFTSSTTITQIVFNDMDVIVTFIGGDDPPDPPAKEISVSYGGRGEGSVTATYDGALIHSGDSVTAGKTAVFTAIPAEGRSVTGWEIKNNQTGEYKVVLNADGTRKTSRSHSIENADENIDIIAYFGTNSAATIKFTTIEDAPANRKTTLVASSETGESTRPLARNGTASLPADGGRTTFTFKPEKSANIDRVRLIPADSALPVLTFEGEKVAPIGGFVVIELENITCDYTVEATISSAIVYIITYDDMKDSGVNIAVAVGGTAEPIANGQEARGGTDVLFRGRTADGVYAVYWNINGTLYPATRGEWIVRDISGHITAQAVFEEISQANSLCSYESWISDNISPGDPLTRATLATLLYGFAGSRAHPGSGTNIINDLGKTPVWKRGLIDWVVEHGYMTTDNIGNFLPNELVTKEQFVTALYRFVTTKGYYLPTVGSPSEVADLNGVSPWAVDAVYYFAERGMIFTDEYGNFNPRHTWTVSEFCTAMQTAAYRIQNPFPTEQPVYEDEDWGMPVPEWETPVPDLETT